MATGYVRQSAGTIVTGNTIQASDSNNEFNALLGAFDASAGHNHDGTVGGGAKISSGSLNGLTTLTTGIISQTSATTFANRVLTGTTNRVTISNGDGVAGNPTFDISAAYVGQATITTLGTITAGVWNGTVVTSTYGGTGVANTGTLTFSGSASVTGTNTGDQTTVSGNAGSATVLQTARNINGVAFNGSANITVTADASTLTNTTLNATVVTSSLTSVGTLTGGTWQATIISPVFGGTGVANAASQTTTRSGLFALTQTLTATTNVTYPTTGTLATLANSETLTNKTINGANNTLTVRAASDITGTLPTGNGGTGLTSPGSSGNILTSNGTIWTSAPPAASGFTTVVTQVFTSSGTYTPTTNMKYCIVELVGGGGGSGGGALAGGNGGTTSLGAIFSASGGTGGLAFGAARTVGSAGGTGTGGDINIPGGTGQDSASSATAYILGAGGNSFYGQGIGATSLAGGVLVGAVGVGFGAGARGSSNGGAACSGAGGGGGYARKTISAATIGASQTVTIGTAGTAGTGAPVGATGTAGIVIITEFI